MQGTVSVCLEGIDRPSRKATYPHTPEAARAQVAGWCAEPATAGSIANVTWEFVGADGVTLVIMWDRGHSTEFFLPAVAAPF